MGQFTTKSNGVNEKIQTILNDLYAFDPGLKAQEIELTKIISKLLETQPETNFDKQFFLSLKQKLQIHIEEQKKSTINNYNFMQKKWFVFGSAAFAGLAIVLAATISFKNSGNFDDYTLFGHKLNNTNETKDAKTDTAKNTSGVKAFASKEEFLAYMAESQATSPSYGGRGGAVNESFAPTAQKSDNSQNLAMTGTAPSPDRVSQTNVQVLSIDEPDILKTNGKQIFYSSQTYYGIYDPIIMEDSVSSPNEKRAPTSSIAPPRQYQAETKVINALPISELKTIGKLDRQGELLLSGNNLVVFNYEGVFGYDISNPEKPTQKWSIKYSESQLETARLLDGKIYLVTKNYLNYQTACPIRPLMLNEKYIEIPCQSIYHPIRPTPEAATFNAFVIDPGTGEVKNKISFIGSFGQSVSYMSENGLYITFSQNKPQLEVIIDFLKTNGKNVLPSEVLEKLEKVQTYEISEQAKLVEMQQILQNFGQGKNQDEQAKLENELQNHMTDYFKQHKRELVYTGIVKIPLADFKVDSAGQVPGTPLNQFSMDEYQGNLRIATTIGQNFWIWNFGAGNNESANDVYVLDANLKTVGSITDLGLTERIYSARFVGNRGYLVTFRQTDPFYVLDLSDPKNPSKKGELKIPGFSSYLHPLAENIMLGIGQENGKVKLSLFDVSNPSNPKELDKYNLDDYWSEAQNNHHAFLQDAKHTVFFLPGSQSGYVFAYKNNKLSLEKVVSQITAKRAVYINDFLYVVGDDKIVVLDESNWERVKELDLR